jgi:hypothetical protein
MLTIGITSLLLLHLLLMMCAGTGMVWKTRLLLFLSSVTLSLLCIVICSAVTTPKFSTNRWVFDDRMIENVLDVYVLDKEFLYSKRVK